MGFFDKVNNCTIVDTTKQVFNGWNRTYIPWTGLLFRFVLGIGLSRLDKTFVFSYGSLKLRASVRQVEENSELATNSVNRQSIAFVSPNISHDAENTFNRSVWDWNRQYVLQQFE